MALRLQGSSYFQVYSLSFTEPWLGGKNQLVSLLLCLIVNNFYITMLQEQQQEIKALTFRL